MEYLWNLEMTTQDNKPVTCRGRSRGLILVWEEERREKNRLWLNTCLISGRGRAETSKALTDMVTKNEQRPGGGWVQAAGRGLTPNPCNLEPVRTQGKTLCSHLQGLPCPPL